MFQEILLSARFLNKFKNRRLSSFSCYSSAKAKSPQREIIPEKPQRPYQKWWAASRSAHNFTQRKCGPSQKDTSFIKKTVSAHPVKNTRGECGEMWQAARTS